eukprot:1387129-Amphidinium_carterae.1
MSNYNVSKSQFMPQRLMTVQLPHLNATHVEKMLWGFGGFPWAEFSEHLVTVLVAVSKPVLALLWKEGKWKVSSVVTVPVVLRLDATLPVVVLLKVATRLCCENMFGAMFYIFSGPSGAEFGGCRLSQQRQCLTRIPQECVLMECRVHLKAYFFTPHRRLEQ